VLQKTLAEEITIRVHSKEDYEQALKSSEILFGKATKENLEQLTDTQLLDIFDGVPTFAISKDKLSAGISILDVLAQETSILPSKGETKKLVSANGIAVNLEKFADVNGMLNADNLINGKYIIVKKGKKDFNLIIAE
jgi:tyrosyl-tRNA synthetase